MTCRDLVIWYCLVHLIWCVWVLFLDKMLNSDSIFRGVTKALNAH